MSKIVDIVIEDGEYWYSGFIDDTVRMPYGKESKTYYDAVNNHAYNEVNPMMISTNGRYLYAEEYGVMSISDGVIHFQSTGDIDCGKKESFKAAYAYLRDRYFPFDGKHPDERLFTNPQYCTWMALGEKPTQAGVLRFAEEIIKEGLPVGELIIDDGWSEYHGQLEFCGGRFPAPKEMCDKLKEYGFFVSVWVTPYVSPDSCNFRELHKKDLLVKKNGEPFICHWWDGYSACIDFTNPAAIDWFMQKISILQRDYGILGVKMDGGDARIYENGLETYDKAGNTANGLAEAYGKVAANFTVSELRSTSKCGGLAIMQRIADRYHAWEEEKEGLKSIVKRSLVMSFCGYPYNCPDMVGGGQMEDVEKNVFEDEELNIRYMQAATFMPSLQFSKKLWLREGTTKSVVKKMLALREKYADYILKQVKECSTAGEPIIRTMCYEYGVMPAETTQFALGTEMIIAPILAKGLREQKVYLPQGNWQYPNTGEIFTGEQMVIVPAPLEELPYFIRCKE